MKNILALLTVYFLLICQAFAVTGVPDSGHWEPAGFGGAGAFPMIVPDHFVQNKIYAIPDVNSPYVSTDKGENWTFLSYNRPSVSNFGISQTGTFVQSKNDANLMYAMESYIYGGLYRSTDGGTSWTKLTTYRGVKGRKMIAIDPNDDDIVYVTAISTSGSAGGGRVYRSIDGGDTWAEYFRPFDQSITSESAELNGTGQTRTGRLNNLNNILKGSVVFTSGSGETFTDNGAGVLVSNAGGSGTITYTNTSSSSYGNYSLTFGTTPSTTTVNYTVSNSASFVYVSSDSAYIIVGRETSSGTSLIKYTISGGTITPITLTGTNATYNLDYDTYVDGSSNEHLCVTAGLKIACTTDFSSWDYTSETTASSSYFIRTFAVKRQSDDDLTFVISRKLTSSSYNTVEQRSLDSGTTWSTSSRSNNTTMNPTGAFNAGNLIFDISADPFDEDIFYLTTDARIYRSDNGGLNFYEKDSGAQNVVQTECTIAPGSPSASNGRIFCTSMDVGIQYSDDFGATWIQGTPDSSKGQPFVTGGLNDYGGHYWRILTLGSQEEWEAGNGIVIATATMYGTNSALYAKNFVIRSTDSGETWSRTNTGLPTVYLAGDTIWGKFFVNGAGGMARALAKSIDETVLYVGMDGENCNADGSGGMPYDCDTPDNFQSGGLFKSTDDGLTWEKIWKIPRKIYNALAIDPTDTSNNTVLFGTVGYNLYRSTPISESAELNGTGQTRTGQLNKTNIVVSGSITFTSSGGETFTDDGWYGTLTSDLGGSGTINYSTGEYSLTFVSTPSSTTATYNWRGYVGDSNGPGSSIFDVAYDSKGTPYAVVSNSGSKIYRSNVTDYGDGSGQWGTWSLMHTFASTGILDGIVIDPRNDNRIFVSNVLGNVSDRGIWVTVNASRNNKATWYDITGDFPVVGGCQSLTINYFEGEKGYLYCSSNGGGLWKLNLADSPASFPGRTVLGGTSLDGVVE